MTEECVFCAIVSRKVEASIAYEDEATLAFMDHEQLHPGHTLVVPKRHIVDMFALDDATGAALMAALSRVARAVHEAFRPDGINLWQANGAPWQTVFHLHFHVLPRWKDDGLLRFSPPARSRPSQPELDDQATRIRSALDREG